MLSVQHDQWNQTLFDLRHQAVHAEHRRTRERFMALYEIALGTNATQWAEKNGRHFQSVQAWVRSYNARGPEGVAFRHAGGWTPLFVQRPESASPSRSTPQPRRPHPRRPVTPRRTR
jgi:hypothetical protein